MKRKRKPGRSRRGRQGFVWMRDPIYERRRQRALVRDAREAGMTVFERPQVYDWKLDGI